MSVEEPAFSVRMKEGSFEVRDYPSLVTAEVVVSGDQKQAANAGFRILAAYIFGGNVRRESIAMTAPVTLFPASDGIAKAAPLVEALGARVWRVRFNMPRRYAIATLPRPKDASIRLRIAPAARVAVIRFSGLAQPEEVKARAVELNAWMAAHQLRAVGAPSLAQYDPPWTLWFLRRNEVMIPVPLQADAGLR